MNKYNSRTKIEEKKKQAAEMFRRFTMQIDSLEKEAVGKRRKGEMQIVDDSIFKLELDRIEQNSQQCYLFQSNTEVGPLPYK